ncbi:hypothetical protein ACFO9Q_08770 [Paenibacillus sp. GCM10023252]|uniref:hypothetical protein n=1 Tax=Paenibacillus sp. GCM10023252 TaxID=3252649 RepID=UPI00361EA465
MRKVTTEEVRKLLGKSIYAVRKDGSVVTGKLVRISQNKLAVVPLKKDKGKLVQTKAIIPLVLFDLLAIGLFAGGGYGYGGGYGPGYGGGCCEPNYGCQNYNNGGYYGGYY